MTAAGNVSPVAGPSREDNGDGRAPLRGRPFLLAGLLGLLNVVAVGGQAAWFHDHLFPHPNVWAWVPAIGVALVVESIGVYLAGMAHAARMADQYAGFLQTGAYAVGALAGTLNFDHFHKVPPAGVTFGMLSAISPWLWAIYSRYVNRDRLARLNRPPSRRFWHPIRTVKVISFAAWEGIPDLDDAVMAWELAREGNPQPVSPAGDRPRTPAEWIAAEADLLRNGATHAQAARQLGVSAAYLRRLRSTARESGTRP